jgi:8-oxo-dGTP diphosphatase
MNVPRLVAVVLLHRTDSTGTSQWLVAKRPAGTHLAGSWEFPGGKVEAGESPEEALRRELAEELGLQVDATAHFRPVTFSFFRYPDRSVLLLFLALDHDPAMGEPQPLASDGLTWLDRDALLALPMPPANSPVREWLAQL